MLCPECGQDDLVRKRVITTEEIVDVCPECDALLDEASGTWHELEDYLASSWTRIRLEQPRGSRRATPDRRSEWFTEHMDRVAAAFEAVPRADFLPHRERRRASYDGPLAIGYGQTNSQPRTVDDMLRLLEVRPGDRVLDVGAGSGWSTALLAHLTGIDRLGAWRRAGARAGRVGRRQPPPREGPVGVPRAQHSRGTRPAGPRAVRPDPGLGRGRRPARRAGRPARPTTAGW